MFVFSSGSFELLLSFFNVKLDIYIRVRYSIYLILSIQSKTTLLFILSSRIHSSPSVTSDETSATHTESLSPEPHQIRIFF